MMNVPPEGGPAPARRLDYVDGLRALAALWVLLHHAVVSSEPVATLGVPIVGPVVGSLFLGQFPVMIFLMLSGFCLYYPYVRKKPDDPAFTTGFWQYLARRANRIAPPYLWAGGFCLIMAAFPALQVGNWEATGPIDGWVILSHLLFVHNLIPAHSAKIDYPMWSIGLEWQLYLLFPLLVWAFRRYGGVLVTGACLVLAAIIRLTYRQLPDGLSAVVRDGPFSYLEIFAAGMIAAALTVRQVKVAPKWVLGTGLVLGLVGIRLGSGNGLVHDLEASLAAFCALMLAADPSNRFARFLNARLLVWIGFFSYSVYLVHAPVLHLIWFALRPLKLSTDLTCLLLLASTPLIVGISYGFHRLFERPYMRVAPSLPRTSSAPAVAQEGP